MKPKGRLDDGQEYRKACDYRGCDEIQHGLQLIDQRFPKKRSNSSPAAAISWVFEITH